MGAAKGIRFAVLMAFGGLFGWLFYIRYAVAPRAEGFTSGAFWIVPAALFIVLAVRTVWRR